MVILKRLWRADLGWWNVPLAAALALVTAAVMMHTAFGVVHTGGDAVSSVSVSWTTSFKVGVFAGWLAAIVATYHQVVAWARRVPTDKRR